MMRYIDAILDICGDICSGRRVLIVDKLDSAELHRKRIGKCLSVIPGMVSSNSRNGVFTVNGAAYVRSANSAGSICGLSVSTAYVFNKYKLTSEALKDVNVASRGNVVWVDPEAFFDEIDNGEV